MFFKLNLTNHTMLGQFIPITYVVKIKWKLLSNGFGSIQKKMISYIFYGNDMTGSQGPLLAPSHLKTIQARFSSHDSNPKLLLAGRYP